MNDADAAALEALSRALPGGVMRPVEPRYLEEPRGTFHGHALAVVKPRDASEVAAVLRVATETGASVVPYSGGTGLVGGQLVCEGAAPIVLSLERMSSIREIFPEEGVMIAEAGVILKNIQDTAAQHGLLFPLTLASEGTCRIGGNLSTNAGGVNVLRYGNTRALCLGLEAVFPDGSIWHGLTRLHKDNTGYDLRDLMIGAEGTLGVITAAALKLFPQPTSVGTAFFAVPSPAAALSLLSLSRRHVGEAVSAFELIHEQGLVFMDEVLPEIRQPLAQRPKWMVLIEIGLHGASDAAEALGGIFEAGVEEGLVLDGVLGTSERQRLEFWNLREHMPEANRRIGAIASHDVSVPLGNLSEFVDRCDAAFAAMPGLRINCFGHVGDGNLHYNIFPPVGGAKADFIHLRPEVTRIVHDIASAVGGSISAEHGIGRLKVGDLERYGDPARIAAMRRIKGALDPANIMNPGAVLRA